MKRYEPDALAGRPPRDARTSPTCICDAPEPPKQTFDKSPFILKDGTRDVRFHFFGWAHTRGDGFVYLPKEKVLCTGDAVVNGPYNFTADANIGNWPKVMRAAQKLRRRARAARPRPPGGQEVLEGQASS